MNFNLDEFQLMRLYDCATSSKYGLPDQGFPKTMQKLAALGLVKQKGNGYLVTSEGLLLLKVNKEKLFGKKRREKKVKKYDRDEEYVDDQNY